MRKTTLAALASAIVIAPIASVSAQTTIDPAATTTVPADDLDDDRDDDSGKWGLLGLLGLAGLLGLKRRDRDDRDYDGNRTGTNR